MELYSGELSFNIPKSEVEHEDDHELFDQT